MAMNLNRPIVALMFESIAILCVLLWALGFFGPWHVALGPLVHVLLVIAVVVVVIRLIQGRRPIV